MQFSYSHFLHRTIPRPGFQGIALRGFVAPPHRDDLTEIDFHRDVQTAMVQVLRAAGNRVEENIRLSASNPGGGTWTYDADWVAKAPDKPAVIFEVKTSVTKKGFEEFDGSEFRRKQFQVLVLANLGGHVVCQNPRIRKLDLIPFVPLPPLAIEILYALPSRPIVGEHIEPGNFQAAVRALDELGVLP